jgi:dTDP-glucose 4,6-dehydratase
MFDFAGWILALILAAVFRFEFDINAVPFGALLFFSPVFAFTFALTGFATHLYRNRYISGSLDELKVLATTIFFVVTFGGLCVIFLGNGIGLPRSLIFIAAPIFLLFAGGLRLILRQSRVRDKGSTVLGKRTLIYGAGDAAEALIPQLLGSPDALYAPVALIDDSPEKSNRWIRGVPMAGNWGALASAVSKFRVEVVLVAIPSANSELLARVYEDSSNLGLRVVVLPTLHEYLGGRTSASDLRGVRIEDLLGRQSLSLDKDLISRLIRGKKVLITGAGGSIGSELARQIAQLKPAFLTLVDRDETGLLLASLEVERLAGTGVCETYLLDIRDKQAVSSLFSSREPDVVFHAAALKHLAMLESFPSEAWKTNVQGTLNVLEAAEASSVGVFANISTDKAANAANTLGLSKKFGEELTAWFAAKTGRPFVSVRFGNVLGSRGSLIPILSEQIASGGPVTITHERATRYFMSIPEACQLVLQAAAQGEDGDVMVLEMGEPVKIKDIAERMIELSGTQVEMQYIGLRPGEKLHEDLLSDAESPIPSGHPKIMRVKATPRSPQDVLALKW